MRSNILIVDDSTTIIHLVSGILEEYHLKFALNGKSALDILEASHDFDLILMDIEMPGMNGYELIKAIKAKKDLKDIPVIFLTVKDNVEEEAKGFALGAVDYIKKPISSAILKARVDNHIKLRMAKLYMSQQNKILENKVRTRTREIMLTRDATIQAMMALLEVRDLESGAHIKRTKIYVEAICNHLAVNGPYQDLLTPERVENMHKAAPLHDVGKVGVPDRILLKPGKLTEEEYDLMKCHTEYAVQAFSNVDELLGDNNFLHVAKQIAGNHHERWDGTGYPNRLQGHDIPLEGRIMALVDVYDALVNERCYKKAFCHETAKEIILEERGAHFDPVVVDAFLALEETFIRIQKKYKSDDDVNYALV